ncbi:MAG TPA: hypothetical protein VGE30_03150 [Candidatus Saccharimonadales bacterium]
MAEVEYVERFDGTYEAHRVSHEWRPTPIEPQEVVDHFDPDQVAQCLIENGDYNGQLLMSAFSEEDVQDFAREDAARIITKRELLLAEREELQLRQKTLLTQLATKAHVKTVYVVSSQPVDHAEAS